MPEIRWKPSLVTEIVEKRGRLAHGDGVSPHRHTEGQLLYPSAGVLATTTSRGTWVAPANRVAWTPPGFEHYHRAYGRTEVRVVGVSGPLCASLPDRPMVFAVSPLLREVLLVLTGGRDLRPEARNRLREVVVDELVDGRDVNFGIGSRWRTWSACSRQVRRAGCSAGSWPG